MVKEQYEALVGTKYKTFNITGIMPVYNEKTGSILKYQFNLECEYCGRRLHPTVSVLHTIKDCHCQKIKINGEKYRIQDTVGLTFNDRTITGYTYVGNSVRFDVTCDICGSTIQARACEVYPHSQRECAGCAQMRYDDVGPGTIAGSYKVIRKVPRKHGGYFFEAECMECHKRICKLPTDLMKCLHCRHETILDTEEKPFLSHRGTDPLYSRWYRMVSMCHDKKNSEFRRYGARGIKVCSEWYESIELQPAIIPGFENFREWAIKNGFRDDLPVIIKRYDKTGDFSPDNCYVHIVDRSRKK